MLRHSLDMVFDSVFYDDPFGLEHPFHPCEGGPLLRAMYLATLVWPMLMPSLRSSPWMRGAPHNGLAVTSVRMRREERRLGLEVDQNLTRDRLTDQLANIDVLVPPDS